MDVASRVFVEWLAKKVQPEQGSTPPGARAARGGSRGLGQVLVMATGKLTASVGEGG